MGIYFLWVIIHKNNIGSQRPVFRGLRGCGAKHKIMAHCLGGPLCEQLSC